MPVDAVVPARANGVLLIGVGLVDWLARGVVGPPLRWLLWVNIVVRGAQTLIHGLGAAMLPPTGFAFLVAAAGGDIALIVVFARPLRRA